MTRVILLSATTAFVLLAPGLAVAEVFWSGPGWYLDDMFRGYVSGPFSTKDACLADANSRHIQDSMPDGDQWDCDYVPTDPTAHG